MLQQIIERLTIRKRNKSRRRTNRRAGRTRSRCRDVWQLRPEPLENRQLLASVVFGELVKSIAATSDPITTDGTDDTAVNPRPLAIGEQVTYRFQGEMSEGVSGLVEIKDKLPDGQQYAGKARIAFVSTLDGSIGSTDPFDAYMPGDETNVDAVLPAFLIPPSNITTLGGPGDEVLFKLGVLSNDEVDLNSEYVVIEFDALVVSNSITEPVPNIFEILVDTVLESTSNQVFTQVVLQDQVGGLRFGQKFRGFLLDANGSGKWDTVPGGDTVSRFFAMNDWQADDLPVAGDWDGDGFDEIGVMRFDNDFRGFLLDLNGNGVWDTEAGGDKEVPFFAHNKWRASDRPVIGDWDGDGTDDVGVLRYAKKYRGFLLDVNGNGTWDGAAGDKARRFRAFNRWQSSDQPVVGDWNGDGIDDLGTMRGVRPTYRGFMLDTNGSGYWNNARGGEPLIKFFPKRNQWKKGDLPVAGDFDGNGIDDIGVYRKEGSRYFLDVNGSGAWEGRAGGDAQYRFPNNAALPLVGKWQTQVALVAAPGVAPNGTPLEPDNRLTTAVLTPIVDSAVAELLNTPLTPEEQEALAEADVRIANLPGAMLGRLMGDTFWLDRDAAGHGWSTGDEEPEADHMDLLTAVFHGLGHALGQGHADEGVMDDLLPLGTRRLPVI